MVDEALVRKLVRRIGWLNALVTFFGILFLAAFVAAGVLLWRAVSYVHTSEQKITQAQAQVNKSLDLQKQLCSSAAASYLSTYCQ